MKEYEVHSGVTITMFHAPTMVHKSFTEISVKHHLNIKISAFFIDC